MTKPKKAKRGRKLSWTKVRIAEYKNKILNEIAINGLSLVKIGQLEGFPSRKVIHEWLIADKNFSDSYARACDLRAEKIAEEILEICDSTEDDIITDIDGNPVTNHHVINRDRLRIDARKWLLAKMAPKKYGDKLDVTTDGEKINDVVLFRMPENNRD
jgi:hypothetical protein